MRSYQPHPCEMCGAIVVKRKRPDRRILCPECALAVMADAARQMSDKSGPLWDAWLASNAAGAPGQAARHTEE